MTYKATLRVNFDTEWTPSYGSSGIYDDETLPEEHYTFKIPAHDINTIQLFRFFGNVARTMGHNEISIMKGACSLAFNDMRSEEEMRKVAEEFDMKLVEDYAKEFGKMQDEIYDLKAKLSRFEQPDNLQYTDEEMDAMSHEEYSVCNKNNIIPGSPAAVNRGCKCPVMDNEEMPDDRKWVNGDCPIHGKVQ